MIALFRSWLAPARRQRRIRHAARPLAEALEIRSVLSVSITANIGGVTPTVLSLSIPQPATPETQDISLVLKLNKGVTKLFHDAASGKVLHNVTITLSSGRRQKDTIDLIHAVVASYQLVQNPGQEVPTVALVLDGQTRHSGSIAATINGATPSVVSLTIPPPATSGAQNISVVVKLSESVTELIRESEDGKLLPAVQFTLDQIGNGSIETISLTNALISSYQFTSAGDLPEVQINLASQTETIGLTS